ncbi:hypothetical protein CRG98_011117 [Punica granatum]|uniref:Uncharacterized protein n=1 Tax=Punica granatum TaxID=22663 RepID=A0A2I0KJ56_PUNGR|nr:hypothetical protein CRG98_011117 [Punica granatum]
MCPDLVLSLISGDSGWNTGVLLRSLPRRLTGLLAPLGFSHNSGESKELVSTDYRPRWSASRGSAFRPTNFYTSRAKLSIHDLPTSLGGRVIETLRVTSEGRSKEWGNHMLIFSSCLVTFRITVSDPLGGPKSTLTQMGLGLSVDNPDPTSEVADVHRGCQKPLGWGWVIDW